MVDGWGGEPVVIVEASVVKEEEGERCGKEVDCVAYAMTEVSAICWRVEGENRSDGSGEARRRMREGRRGNQ